MKTNTMTARLQGWTARGNSAEGLPVLTRGQVTAVQGNGFIRMQLEGDEQDWGDGPQVTIKTTSGSAVWGMLDILIKDLISRADSNFDNGVVR